MVYVDEEARKKRTFAGRKPIPESTKDEIITDYNAGMSAKKIAEKLYEAYAKEVENEKLQRSRSMQGLRYLYGGIKLSSGFALSD